MEQHDTTFYGTATVGTKGQIVIPLEARQELGIKPGDKLVIIGIKDRGLLGAAPVRNVESLFNHLTQKLNTIRKALDETKEEK